MQIKAESKHVRISPRKARLIVGAVKKLPLEKVLIQLQFINKRAAKPILATIKSALANAVNNFKLKEEDLKIASIKVNEGPSFKRLRPAARGVGHGYKKRTSHIKVILQERRKHGTKS